IRSIVHVTEVFILLIRDVPVTTSQTSDQEFHYLFSMVARRLERYNISARNWWSHNFVFEVPVCERGRLTEFNVINIKKNIASQLKATKLISRTNGNCIFPNIRSLFPCGNNSDFVYLLFKNNFIPTGVESCSVRRFSKVRECLAYQTFHHFDQGRFPLSSSFSPYTFQFRYNFVYDFADKKL
ncbi:hypothetical protein L9F63_015154, partial [Diploptera punctata]